MAETLGLALEFWHGVALTVWFVCEGPYSRTPCPASPTTTAAPTTLRDAGCPVAPNLFEELRTAEQHLVPEEAIVKELREFPVEVHRVRDIVTRHRRA
ncbi:hypothetical protein ACFRCW_19300 [Streptomyces sp. NPDC056653]|uniref:hypothetical protein n=1 Tax=Streptomyces sp. NPDC056653 TaxID=3345894 RepID=UPI0036BD1D67